MAGSDYITYHTLHNSHTGPQAMLTFLIAVVIWSICARYTYKFVNLLDGADAFITYDEETTHRAICLLIWPIVLLVVLYFLITDNCKWRPASVLDIIFGPRSK